MNKRQEPTRQELLYALREAHQQVLDLQARLDEFKWLEGALRERTRELDERMKELQCLHAVAEAVRESGHSLRPLLQRIVEEVPAGFQYPSRTFVRLRLGEMVHCSKNFREAAFRRSAAIDAAGCTGEIEVFVAPPARLGESVSLLAEEAALLQTLAVWIGRLAGPMLPSGRRERQQIV